MRSVYVRILLWSIGILLLSWVAFILVSRSIALKAFAKDGDLGILISTQLEEANRVYQAEGKTGLEAYMQTLNKAYPGDHYYIVSDGRDLFTGANLSRLTAQANSRWSIFRLTPPVFSLSSPNNNYALLLEARSRNLRGYLPYYLLLLCVIAALCWMLTLQLASPLKRLIDAVERFGAGDLSARANVVRRDEIGSLASAFDQMANRIETLLVAERRLLQDLSHELRSPLSRLLMALRLADQGDLETARVRMHKEVRRIVDLVESLTQVTRAETDLGTSRLERVAMDVLVRELVEDCHFEARDRECRILVGGQSHATLLADRELLRRAIENVFRNAAHHAPSGSTIDITLNRSDAEVTVSVRDYGPGVPPKDLANIFKPFFRADESRNAATGGVGLGLAIAERALRVHDGQIWAENADPGLRVYIKLPVEHAVELAAINT